MDTAIHLTRSPRLALLLALAALMLTAGATNAAPGYNEPLRSTGERIDAGSPSVQPANDLTAPNDTARDRIAPTTTTTDLAPNPLPDPRVSPATSATGVAPNPLPKPRVSPTALPARRDSPTTTTNLAPNPLPDPRVSPAANAIGVAPNPLPNPRVGAAPLPLPR